MKKGLLSLLAVALTIVSCQNYDDQFAELTELVEGLGVTVSALETELSTILDEVSDLETTINGVDEAVDAITENLGSVPADLATLTENLAIAQGNITTINEAIATLLANGNTTSSTLAELTANLAIVKADVKTLLEADAVINQNIIINNSATLLYAATLVSTETGENAGPNVIVNGFVDIDTKSFNPAITPSQLEEVEIIAAKIATILGDSANKGLTVNTTAALDFAALSFVDADVELNGSAQTLDRLATISGDLTTNYVGDAIFTTPLSSVGTVTISNNGSTTNVDFTGVTVSNFVSGSASAGVLTFPNAININLGTAKFSSLDAAKAESINSDLAAATGSITVTATLADSINLGDLVTVANDLTINANGTTDVIVSALTSVNTLTVSDSNNAHFDKLVSAAGPISVGATTASRFNALTSINANSSIGGATVNLSALAATSTGTLTLPDAVALNAPVLVNGAVLTANKALTATLLSSTQPHLVLNLANTLNLTSLTVSFTAVNTNYPALATLNATGKSTQQNGVTGVEVDITSAATLTTVNLDGKFNAATIDGAGVTAISTDGYITDLTIQNTKVAALDLDHSYIGLDTAPTLDINNNAKLISIDMAGVSKLKTISLTSNVSLTTIVAPVTTGTDIFAEAGAAIEVTVTGNDLSATYTEGVTGTIVTQTVPSQDAEAATLAVPAGIESLLDWYDAAAAITTTASAVHITFETVSYVDRVRSTVDGSITDTASTTTFASFHAATLLDSYSSDPAIGLSDGTGFHGVNSDKELAIVVRD